MVPFVSLCAFTLMGIEGIASEIEQVRRYWKETSVTEQLVYSLSAPTIRTCHSTLSLPSSGTRCVSSLTDSMSDG